MPGSRRAGYALAVAAVVFLVCWAVRFLPSGDAEGLLNFDLYNYYMPAYRYAYAGLLEHGPRFWNPMQMCGIPSVATQQVGFFYPFHLLYVLLPVPLALVASGLVHLAIVGVCTYGFARRLRLGLPAAALAGGLVAFLGPYPKMLFFPNMLEAAAWLPLGCVAVLLLARRPAAGWVALLAAALGLSLLAGYPQATLFSLYCWGLLAVGLLVVERPPLRRAGRTFLGFAASVVLGLLIAGVQLGPAAALSRVGLRRLAGLSLDEMFFLGWSHPVLPGLLGRARWSLGGGDEMLQSLAVLAPLLAVVGLFSRRHRTSALILGGLGSLAILYAAGPRTPVFAYLARLPLLDVFRQPERSLFVASFALGLVAAIGVERLARALRGAGETGSRERQGVLALTVVLVLGALGLAVHVGAAVSAACATLVLGSLALAAARPAATSAPLAWVLTAALLVEILFVPGFVYRYLPDPERLARYEAERPAHEVVRRSDQRVLVIGHGGIGRPPAKYASVLGLRSVDDYEPQSLRRQGEFFGYLVAGRLPTEEEFIQANGNLHLKVAPIGRAEDGRQRLLDLAAARFLLVDPIAAESWPIRRLVERAGMKLLPESDDRGLLFDNPRASPRAYVVYGLESAPPAGVLLDRLGRASFDPLERTYLEADADELPRAGYRRRGEAASLVSESAHRVEVAAELAAPGALVLTDTHAPGWTARLADGTPLRPIAANHLFRAVLLPAGSHRVIFEYRSPGLRLGLLGTLCGLAGLGMLVRAARRTGAAE